LEVLQPKKSEELYREKGDERDAVTPSREQRGVVINIEGDYPEV
jgi:hypothetical protein